MGRRKSTLDGERYQCKFPGCGRSYTRADHLSRHQLNHAGPAKTLQCDRCDRTFVRPDLLTRHQQRHTQWEQSRRQATGKYDKPASIQRILNDDDDDDDEEDEEEEEDAMHDDGDDDNNNASRSGIVGTRRTAEPTPSRTDYGGQRFNKMPRLSEPQLDTSLTSASHNFTLTAPASTNMVGDSVGATPIPPANNTDATTNRPNSHVNGPATPLFDEWPDLDDIAAGQPPAGAPSGHQTPSLVGLHGLAPSTANFSDFSWLFDGIEPTFGNNGASAARSEHTNSASAWSMSPDAFFLQPPTSEGENRDEIGSLQRAIDLVPANEPSYNIEPVAHHRLLVFLQSIPELCNTPYFTIQALRLYLHLFFTRFNSVYPMIHQPTFSASSTDPSLLASVIMIGTFFSVPSAYELAVRIAQKMWSAMLNLDDFRPTRATLPMLQAMVLTEFFAKTMTTRPQHEMAHLFHSFMVTLARRNALFIGQHRTQAGQGASAWKTWAREEERKRVTFFLFVLDSQHATVFGHAPVVSAFEIHLHLPCTQAEWSAPTSHAWDEVRRATLPPPRLFIAAVKAQLTRGNAPGQPATDSFARFLILHGLMSVGFDLKYKQQSLLEGVDEDGLSLWQEKVRIACCHLREACDGIDADATDELSGMLISATQMILYVDVLNILVAAGQPAVLGRVIDRDSYRASQQTIHRWAQSRQGPIAVWHAAQFLRSSLRRQCPSQELEKKYRGGRLEETLHRGWCEYVSDVWGGQRDSQNHTLACLHQLSNALPQLAVLVVWAYGYTCRPKSDTDRASSSTRTSRSAPWMEPAMPLQGPYHEAVPHRSDVEDFLESMCTRKPQDIISSPWKSCTRPVLEVVEKNLRNSRWDLAQEAADLLQRLIQHHSIAMPSNPMPPRHPGFMM